MPRSRAVARGARAVAPFLCLLVPSACDPPPATQPVAAAPTASAATPGAASGPVFADRTKQAPYERGKARLAAIRNALLSPNLGEAQTAELGFECAALRGDKDAVASETDPIVRRFIADVGRTCAFDVPLATAYVELHAIEVKRLSNGSVKSECFGLRVAMKDFGPAYRENPQVTEVAGKFTAWCSTTE